MTSHTEPTAVQTVAVFHASQFVVTEGVAEGDSLSFADELVMDDVYQLDSGAKRGPLSLNIHDDDAQRFVIAKGTGLGQVGNRVVLDCCITMMAPDSTTYEVLVLVEVEGDEVAGIFLLPLATLLPKTNYRLVGLDRHTATTRFAEVACVSFTRGTHITLASGRQVQIEDLQIGDKVLTRDDGPQAIRWIGLTTLRAVGDFAPVVIRKGTLHNAHDLVVSPDHRLFIYQRQDRLGAGRHEVLVKVRHLINGDSVYQQDGGSVDYFQLLFDDHQIIYAEGIAAESLLVGPRAGAALPAGAGGGRASAHAHRNHMDYEVKSALLSQPDAVALLRRASRT
jgi:hypothetical protein